MFNPVHNRFQRHGVAMQELLHVVVVSFVNVLFVRCVCVKPGCEQENGGQGGATGEWWAGGAVVLVAGLDSESCHLEASR